MTSSLIRHEGWQNIVMQQIRLDKDKLSKKINWKVGYETVSTKIVAPNFVISKKCILHNYHRHRQPKLLLWKLSKLLDHRHQLNTFDKLF